MIDDMTAFERQLAAELRQMAGPGRRIDAMAMAREASTHSPTGRFQSMFSATKFVLAGAIVALFGGFLLAGVLSSPRGDAPAPAAVTDSPSPMTTEALLSGMVTDEVEPGIYRVDSDGIRPLSRPMGTNRDSGDIYRGMLGSVVAGLDGSVWWFDQGGFFRLGEPAVHAWPNDRQDTFPYRRGWRADRITVDLEVGSDGTVWLARSDVGERPEGEISSFDGESWSVHQELSTAQAVLGLEVLPDGSAMAAWVDESQFGEVTVARLGDAGWEPLPGVRGDRYGDLLVAGADSSDAWLMPGQGQRLQHHDGIDWVVQMTPEAGGEVRADIGPNGTLWVGLSPTCGPGTPGSQTCLGGAFDVLARFDGTEWDVFDSSDGVPVTGHHEVMFDGLFEAAPDGSIWFDPYIPYEDQYGTDCDGVANFDGQALRHYLRGMCIYAMDVAPDGAVWVQGAKPADPDPSPIHTYVITTESVAAGE